MKPSTGSESWEERFMEFCKETAGFTQSCDEQYCEDFNVSWNELAFIDDMKKFIATEVAHAKAEARREVMEEIKKLQKSRILQKESNARGNARTEGYWKACRDMLKLLTHLSKDKEV